MKYKKIIKTYIDVSFYCLLIAISFNMFFLPFEMVIGGSSGISILVNFLFGLKPSLVVLGVHILAILIGWKVLGWKRIRKSIYGSFAYPFFIELSSPIKDLMIGFNIGLEHLFIMIVLGSVLNGWASGKLYKIGYTSGGSDIFNQIINKLTGITMGTSNFIFNSVIVLSGGFILGWAKVLYAVLILYIIGVATDRAQLGSYSNKAFYIISNKDKEVTDFIKNKLDINVTAFEAISGFENKERSIIMCVISNSNYYNLKEGIQEIDPDALFIITHAYELEPRIKQKTSL